MIVGIDLDNTIASYDTLMSDLAAEAGLLEHSIVASKQRIRDRLRTLPNGEAAWQRIQATAYGARMNEAVLITGVTDFFCVAHKRNIPLSIISHKSERAAADSAGVNLRQAAQEWMVNHHFFSDPDFGLSSSSIFFEATRKEKIERIVAVGCTHFIDDLVETFTESSFPPTVEKILFSPEELKEKPAGVRHCTSWAEITNHFFGDAG